MGAIEDLARDTERRCPGTRITVGPSRRPGSDPRVDRTGGSRQGARVGRAAGGRTPAGLPAAMPGSTDGTILRTVLIPIVTFGPGNRLIPHQVDEHVPVAELVEATRCYAAPRCGSSRLMR